MDSRTGSKPCERTGEEAAVGETCCGEFGALGWGGEHVRRLLVVNWDLSAL